MEFVSAFHAMSDQLALAHERGASRPPIKRADLRWSADLRWHPPPAAAHPLPAGLGPPAVDWNEVVQGIKQYGIRNAAQTRLQPTGTIATVGRL